MAGSPPGPSSSLRALLGESSSTLCSMRLPARSDPFCAALARFLGSSSPLGAPDTSASPGRLARLEPRLQLLRPLPRVRLPMCSSQFADFFLSSSSSTLGGSFCRFVASFGGSGGAGGSANVLSVTRLESPLAPFVASSSPPRPSTSPHPWTSGTCVRCTSRLSCCVRVAVRLDRCTCTVSRRGQLVRAVRRLSVDVVTSKAMLGESRPFLRAL
ncbi:hypothetical protein L210DRAFT_2875372 [Boletus edulis BED1]|uniref:Uncharacterized protein n=1 Tax=Boletus edulis BED1 TaxID=1328754 RepID=A0AAD4BJG7_BOLED|nr:hypothetical protein L210DRAFT_2875372 [Boletus edulis BED1]